MLRYVPATASIYGVCSYGPSGPAPTFAGANFANPPLVGIGPLTPLKALIALIQCCHPAQCFSGARGHGGLPTAVNQEKGRSAMMTLQEQYVVDTEGNKTAVILPLQRYEQLLEDLHDLAVVAERREEKPISLEEMKRRLREDGLL
jgi:PHD/YefM family antitoxin component YafN of YafNO toxin-antitoxin module